MLRSTVWGGKQVIPVTRSILFTRSSHRPTEYRSVNFSSKSSSSFSWSSQFSHSSIFIVAAAGIGVNGLLLWTLPELRKRILPSSFFGSKKGVSSKASLEFNQPIEDLPESIPYLIIGGGAASFSAVRSIRANDPKAKVVVVTEEDMYPYMKPPLTKEVWSTPPEVAKTLIFRQFDGRDRSICFEKEEFYFPLKRLMSRETGGVSVLRGQKITRVDASRQEVYFANGQKLKYEKCLLATGGEPKMLPVFMESTSLSIRSDIRDKVTTYRRASDFLHLMRSVDDPMTKTVVIVGGGFLGSELACSLGRRCKETNGPKIIQIFPEDGNLSHILPKYLSEWTTEKVRNEGVEVITNADITAAEKSGRKVRLKLTDGKDLDADHVVVAVGLSPQIELASTSGLEVHPELGGFVVNSELEARSNLWAAGDASCFYDTLLGRRRVEHHDHAVVSGRQAGKNMTGAKESFDHQSMFWCDLGPAIGFEAVGHLDSSLDTVGVFEVNEKGEQDLSRGMVFYLRNKRIIGMLMWNLFNRIRLARRLIKDNTIHTDFTEVAKLFEVNYEEGEE